MADDPVQYLSSTLESQGFVLKEIKEEAKGGERDKYLEEVELSCQYFWVSGGKMFFF